MGKAHSEEVAGRIETIERIKNSYSGNPRFRIELMTETTTGNRWCHRFNTAADASFNYEVGNPGLRVGDMVIVLLNGRGTISGMEPLVRFNV